MSTIGVTPLNLYRDVPPSFTSACLPCTYKALDIEAFIVMRQGQHKRPPLTYGIHSSAGIHSRAEQVSSKAVCTKV